jgi:hypothetical protein
VWEVAYRVGRVRTGEVGLSVCAEGCQEAAPVAGAGGQHDVARFDAVQRDRGEVGTEVVVAGRDDGHGLSGGDELVFVLDGFGDGAVGCRASAGPGVDAPEGAPGRVGLPRPGDGFVGDVVEGDRFLAGQAVVQGHYQHPRLVVEPVDKGLPAAWCGWPAVVRSPPQRLAGGWPVS